MTTFTIELTGGYTIGKGPRDKSWSSEVTVDLDKLGEDMVRNLALHGLKQKIADAASGATTEAEATGAMSKAMDAIMAGEWSSRGSGGEGVDEFTAVARSMVRAHLKATWGKDSAKWKAFDGTNDQAEKLDKVFADNEAIFRPLVETKVAERKAERERKAALKGKVEINI